MGREYGLGSQKRYEFDRVHSSRENFSLFDTTKPLSNLAGRSNFTASGKFSESYGISRGALSVCKGMFLGTETTVAGDL